MTYTNSIPPYLYDVIKKRVNLADFLETEVGCKLEWLETDTVATAICPLHEEKKPSFRISKTEDNIWLYFCYGCGKKGTIIDFFMDYYDISNPGESVLRICKKFNIKNDADLAAEAIKDVKKSVNMKKKVDCANIVASNQCRCLLRHSYEKNSKWVAEAYKKMNKALDEEDMETIESVGFEASSRMDK